MSLAHSKRAIQRLSQVCYGCRMAEVASRELRNNTRALLDRVEAGESVTITVDGRPVARLEPVSRRPQWVSREEFVDRQLAVQADASLTDELRDLVPDTTDDLPLAVTRGLADTSVFIARESGRRLRDGRTFLMRSPSRSSPSASCVQASSLRPTPRPGTDVCRR